MVRSTTNKTAAKLRAQVEQYIKEQGTKTFNYRQVSSGIGAGAPINQRAVALKLAEMAFDGDILEVSPGVYKLPSRGN
ncbi:MAG: hypothetical protein K2N91_04675, partial [Muribaculaceae bacterium]|nr:hypothetical protein [Muribaculaceae bacterium]